MDNENEESLDKAECCFCIPLEEGIYCLTIISATVYSINTIAVMTNFMVNNPPQDANTKILALVLTLAPMIGLYYSMKPLIAW